MNNILSEKEYQKFILEQLKGVGYEIASAIDFDRLYAVNRPALFRFLDATQSEQMEDLRKIYKDKTQDIIVSAINAEETKNGGSRLDVLKHGITVSNISLKFLYSKPATDFNKETLKRYKENIFSVAEEVWASDKERIDLVLFLNGLAIITFELKANTAGQSYKDAIYQFRMERNPKTRLFRFKAGALVNFAMDLEQVYMTTKLDGKSTFFLPFNMGNGKGIDAGAGNPLYEDKYSVFYMWENILQKDSLLEIITKFMFIEVKVKQTKNPDKPKRSETVIFPRYHQLDVLCKLMEDVRVNFTSQNYLLQHSAGSGKTNEIAWLAHRLASLHDMKEKQIFDNIVICTDRIVVDRQLQDAVKGIEHKSGFIIVMDDKCKSGDLKNALIDNAKVIVTTIQKFPHIVKFLSEIPKKNFAVIIDEAHSSTAGKNMAAVTTVLSGKEAENDMDVEEMITDEIEKAGKQTNVAMFAFTATPKPTTLQLFGRMNTKGQKEAFHIYSMKQAIEEGFILDVLSNYTTYKTYYKLNKAIEDDPELKTNEAKRQIARFVELHNTNIAQRIEVIIEHFRTTVMKELGGAAKAMVITASRASAVKYRQALEDYVVRKGYKDIHALVAFSGKVSFDGTEYTEVGMNGFAEKELPKKFDTDEYQVLLVADKYQTGFDQRKLCAMYILKKLHGISTVQTLSRLNRICPPYDKKTFILDFCNEYEDIVKDFSKYYTTTLLSNSVTPSSVYNLEAKLDGYYFLDPLDVAKYNEIIYQGKPQPKEKKALEYMLQKAKNTIEAHRTAEEINEIIKTINHFIRFYEFLLQATCFEDVELHKKYNFLADLQSYLKINSHGGGFNLNDKIAINNFAQKKGETHNQSKINPDPIVKLPEAAQLNLTPQKLEHLSQIIAEINSKTGKGYDNDVAVKAMLQIKDLLLKSDKLKASAKTNTEKDFEFAYYDNIDNALIEGLSQNQDFFSMLLNNDEIKKEILGIFSDEIYKELRK